MNSRKKINKFINKWKSGTQKKAKGKNIFKAKQIKQKSHKFHRHEWYQINTKTKNKVARK